MAEHIDGILRRPAVWAVAALTALAAAILVLVGIGSFGLWTPAETALASAALADPADASLPALGLHLFGPGEAAARLPGAVVALLSLGAVAWASAGFGSRRAGLLAAIALAGFPLFVLQARQLTSDLPACLGMALALGGLRRWAHAGAAGWGAFAAVAGLLIATAGAGVLGGALPLLAGAALAFALADPGGAGRPRSWRMIARASAGLAAALVITLLVVRHKAGVPSNWAAWLLGGVPRGLPATASFEAGLETVGFGLFPLAGVVMFALCEPMRPGRAEDVDGLLLLATAALALALATVQLHLLGQMNRAVVLAPAALALGRWFDRQLAVDDPPRLIELAGASPKRDVDARLGFVLAVSALLLARDLSLVPEALLSVHLPARIAWPPGLSLSPWVLGVGITCAAGLLILLIAPARTRSRWRTGAVALVLGPPLLLAFALAHHLVPAVARHLSSRAQLDRFAALAPAGATLALYRVGREEAGVFAPPPTLLVPGAADLIAQLRRTPDLFALIPRGELAALEAAAAQAGVPFAIADASSMRHLLLAGRLPGGVADDNPLRPFVWHDHPTAPGRALAAPAWADPAAAATSTWGDAVALVRAEFPREAARGKRLSLTLVFRVTARPPAGYKIFVHLERPGQPLLTGDHAPLGGDFPTDHWRPGDVVRDVHVIDLPRVTTARGPHRLSVGFWPGGEGGQRWPISAGSNDGADRATLGSVQIR